jgi:hypothetical protein
MSRLPVSSLLSFALLALLGSGTPAAGAAPDSRGAVITGGFGLGDPAAPEGLWGGGRDFKVHLGPRGLEFHPALGPAAPHTPTWSYEVQSIARDGAALWSRSAAAPPQSIAGRTRTLALAPGLAERAEVVAAGVEISYVFAERPAGHGALEVRARVATDLALQHSGADGLEFAWPGLGGVAVGAVLGIDARGERAAGSIELRGGELVLALPGAFVDAAAYPLVLDPLISTSTVAFGFIDHFDDVAYDFSTSTYLAVFTRAFSAVDLDVRGQLLDGGGSPVGLPLFLESAIGTQARDATVGGANASNRFLVAWLEGGAVLGSPGDDARMRAVSLPTGALSAIVPLDTLPGTQASIEASTQANATQTNVLLAAVHAGASFGVRQIKVPPSGDPTVGVSTLILSSPGVTAVAASGSGGEFGRHLFACIDGAGDLRLALVDGAAALLGSLTIAAPAGHELGDPALDGDGSTFLVAWEDHVAGQPATQDVRGARVAWNGTALVLEHEAALLDDPAAVEELGGVAFIGSEYLVSWSRENAGGDADLLIAAFQSDCATCEPIAMVAGATAIDERAGAAAAERSGGLETGDRALFGWSAMPTKAGVPSVSVGLFEELLGVETDLGGGCGEGGTCSAPCARVGNPDWVHRLSGAAPFAIALLDLGIAPVELPVGGGTVKTLPLLLILAGFTDAGGSISLAMAIPDDPALAGASIYDQWVVLDPSPCTDLGVDLSNGLQVTIQ